ncbi:Uncharacterised protein [BD1-7 clade bacterium]|uniref:DUF4442 domain-containing protein n=1 Tax=BD1-7 clade bacterium TaxID=2029982 RepID=A0A5S9QTN0_9GAMM|nr:Uncharacterised protein [BD1-7 clade bacterium]
MSQKANQLSRAVWVVSRFPSRWQPWLLSRLMGTIIPFAGTAKIRVTALQANECIVQVKNRKRVQNHIGSVHAAAMALIAESATGFMTALSVPDNRIIVLRSMELTYVKRATGDMTARAYFSPEQLTHIQETEKGDIEVPVTITDVNGDETVEARMVWAWTPKKKKS